MEHATVHSWERQIQSNHFNYIDAATWDQCYECGYRETRYPVPAVRYEWDWFQELLTKEITLVMITYGVYPCD